ncbi:ArgS-related anticodon-binding protein NrtL [Streptomyces sp. KMM 9044]|uniref:ArgS-related anticodon-binding protein NrtL n=1 Tax=Streptomyces sp. KMM 9044 TaxID=2744474 RepID=UPI0021509868|nr:DALR anticodon-binding domain-containing protein [Streptomyces sp. KMM 9044]WAX77916.1 DALR anticodon-binding domain-containing protein [Streptomyces sp. KMM 9044]
MTPVELSRTVLRAVRRAVDDGELSVAVPERVVVAPPGPGGCGEYATNVALRLARPAGRTPQHVAEVLRTRLLRTDGIGDVVITGPGFLNISLCEADVSVALVTEVLGAGDIPYGHLPEGSREPVLLRGAADVRAFVHLDALARTLRAQGHFVRVGFDAPPASEWGAVLGEGGIEGAPLEDEQSADAQDSRPPVTVRPVPAPADPLPLGRDAARWALLRPAARDRPRISGEHLEQRESNPLFRVRYAHARTRALARNAADLGFRPEPGPVGVSGNRPLLTALADHPRVLAAAARHRAPDRLARHLVTVADATQPLLPAVLPLGAEKPSAVHRARLALADAAGTVLADGLSLLGIDAPDHL